MRVVGEAGRDDVLSRAADEILASAASLSVFGLLALCWAFSLGIVAFALHSLPSHPSHYPGAGYPRSPFVVIGFEFCYPTPCFLQCMEETE